MEGTCLYMDIWEDDAIWLAVLFRQLTPDGLGLDFCDDGYTFDVCLPPPGTTEAELADLTETVWSAAVLTGHDPKTVKRYVEARASGRNPFAREPRPKIGSDP